MNKITSFLLITSFIIFSFSCKKDEAITIQTPLKILNLKTDKTFITTDNHFLTMNNDGIVSKIDFEGKMVWSKKLLFNLLTPLKNGGFATLENMYDTINYKFYQKINTFDKNANLLNSSSFSLTDSSTTFESSFTELQSGDLILLKHPSYNSSDNIIIKIDADLNPLWEKKINLSSNSWPNLKEIDNQLLFSDADYIAAIDTSGTLIWEKTKKLGKYSSYPTNILNINKNELLISGFFDAATDLNWNQQFFAYKININGEEIGNTFIEGGTKQDICMTSCMDLEGNFILAGMIGRNATNISDITKSSIRIMKLDKNLNLIFDKIHAEEEQCRVLNCQSGKDKQIYLFGEKQAYNNSTILHSFILKVNSDGTY